VNLVRALLGNAAGAAASRSWPLSTRHVVNRASLALLFLVSGLFLAACSSPTAADYNFGSDATAVMPAEVDGRIAQASPEAESTLEQLKQLAPNLTNAKAATVSSANGDEVGAVSLFVLQGPTNSLNTLEDRISVAMGSGREAKLSGPEGTARYQYRQSQVQVAGLEVAVVSTVDGSGKSVESWALVRPKDDVLIAGRDIGNNQEALVAGIEATLAKAQG
jgi:hypothetical protein